MVPPFSLHNSFSVNTFSLWKHRFYSWGLELVEIFFYRTKNLIGFGYVYEKYPFYNFEFFSNPSILIFCQKNELVWIIFPYFLVVCCFCIFWQALHMPKLTFWLKCPPPPNLIVFYIKSSISKIFLSFFFS